MTVGRARFFDLCQLPDSDGFIKKVPNPVVTIYENGTTTPIADTIYSAASGVGTLTNPFTSGSADGEVEFFLATAKRVSIKFDGTASGYGTATWDDQAVWPDPAQLNTTITSENGLYTASVTDDGEFNAFGILRSFGVYNPEDYGCVPGYTSANKAANTAAFEAMLAEIGTNGGGDIVIANNLPVEPIDFSHGGSGSRAVNISGRNGEGGFQFFDAAGPFLDIASVIGNRLDRCGIQDILINFSVAPTSGAAIRLGYCYDYALEGVKILLGDDGLGIPNQSGYGALVGIEARMGFVMRDSIVTTRTDVTALTTAGLFPVGVLFSGPDLTGGPEFYESQINGCATRSYGVRFAGAGFVDTPRMSKMLIKDHHTTIMCNSGAGGFGNGVFSDLVLDGATKGIFLSPAGPVANNQFSNTWISATAAALDCDHANGGSVGGLSFYGGYWTNSLTTCVNVATGVEKVRLFNIHMPTSINTGGEYGILMGGTSGTANGHKVHGCTVEVSSGATAAARFSSASTRVTVVGNTWIGKDATPGITDGVNGCVYLGNSYA